MTDDIRLPFERNDKLGEKRKLRAARGSGNTATKLFQPYLSPGLPCFQDQNIPGYSGPIEGIFIMKVVDIRAFSALFVAWIALFSGSEYTGVFWAH